MSILNLKRKPAVQIIPVQDGHLPIITELAGVIWRAHYPGIISLEQIEYMLARMYAPATMQEEIRSQGIWYDLLLVDNKPAGFAACGPVPPNPGTAGRRVTRAFKLHKLYLVPELHGRGLGSRLLQHVEHTVRAAGGRRLILSVNKNNARAIAAYRRNGFNIAESVTTDIGSGYVMDDYIMAKELDAACE